MIKPLLAKTKRREVLGDIGGFGGLFSLSGMTAEKDAKPILVATTDGVGTKLKLAHDLKRYDGIGQDLVAMCVNDLVCCGAEPLFFLDYFATGELDLGIAKSIMEGMTEALASVHCALIGGETAEMPGLYQGKEFDLAGFAVGIVNRDDMIDCSHVSIGNKVIGLASNGVHSNGFSLVRKIIETRGLKMDMTLPQSNARLGELLLAPTRLYVNTVLKLRKEFSVFGMAHITGGGLLENVPRVIPASSAVKINTNAWPVSPLFRFLEEAGNVPTLEMFRVFNMGIGFVLIVPETEESEVLMRLRHLGETPYSIGEIVERPRNTEAQVFLQ
jgi:phosphoribosylformylglycinamidine cyclo-ligase